MGNNTTILITSTINVPTFLESVCRNAVNHRTSYLGIVIGDEKTPIEARSYCNEISEKYGVEHRYLDLDDQYKLLQDYKDFLEIIPKNDNTRKMIGTWLAYMEGCERVIMIDDDNYATEENFIDFHEVVGAEKTFQVVSSDSGWFNICETMIEQSGIPFYPRGYPWAKRFKEDQQTISSQKSRTIVNNGLVLGDPDVDAVTRLFWPIRVTDFKEEYFPTFGLKQGTWAPFNDQNTCISRDLIPIYFKPPSVFRNADIWTSYLIQKLAEGTGDIVTFGQPIVDQIRNEHDIRKDYVLEEIHNRATDKFVDLLRKIEPSSNGYLPRLKETIEIALDLINSNSIFYGEQDRKVDQRHAQLPNDQERAKMIEEEKALIRNFFEEYKIWTNLMLKMT